MTKDCWNLPQGVINFVATVKAHCRAVVQWGNNIPWTAYLIATLGILWAAAYRGNMRKA